MTTSSSFSLGYSMRPPDQVVPGGDTFVRHAHADGALVLVRLALRDEALGLLAAMLHPVELERDLSVPVQPEPAERILDLRTASTTSRLVSVFSIRRRNSPPS